MELMPIIDAYRFADDMTTFTVDLGENEQQKMLVSPKALTQDINVMNEANPAGDKSGQLKDNDTVITKTRVADTPMHPQDSIANNNEKTIRKKPKEKEPKAQPTRIKVKAKAACSSTAFPRAPMSYGQSPMLPRSTKPVIKQKTVTVDKIKQSSVAETRNLLSSTETKRKQTSCSIDRQPTKKDKTYPRIPAISVNGSATQGQINQSVRRGWDTRRYGRQDQLEVLAWQKPEHRFGSMVIERR
ncbi:hypothetical protein B5807_10946 [Epicoccum nigrum]|uniref:Uncharacterized protein n=1 Tax=Epicoccum nigrum TaxID=105696 RepID=A0A1Y2LK91_EPING|nr:hypothetical protein B5807_10946 [Epicoccum nigrum]